MTGQPTYNIVSGPAHRIDLTVSPIVPVQKLGVRPHGLIGQSFDGSGVPRFGRVDAYPQLNIPGNFRTTAMAEGAIEGIASDYEVKEPYATSFRFSVF